MRRFKVIVSHKNRKAVQAAFEALNNMNFNVGGPDENAPAGEPLHHAVTVQGLRARDEADARKRVQGVIPPDAGYRFEITEE